MTTAKRPLGSNALASSDGEGAVVQPPEKTPGREPVQIVEIVQPYCANTFGNSPCTAAVNDASQKCFNTRGTCLDPDNFDSSTSLSLYFSKGNVADRGVDGVNYLFPSLISVSTVPTRINLSGANPDAKGLGNRATCRVVFQDHPHTDRVVDPYLNDRSYDPLQRGSFWTKWLARNVHRYNVFLRVYEGYAGQTLNQMRKREYVTTGFRGPDERGKITVEAKDLLARIEQRKAQAPAASPGILQSNISASANSFTVENATVDDYPASGTLRINDEVMTYTTRAAGGAAGEVDFSGVTRGTDNTTADSHEAEDSVQRCLRYSNEPCADIVEDLLTTWGGIPAQYVDSANTFNEEQTKHLAAYNLTTLITEPVGVDELISELQLQVGFFVWWDERVRLIKFRAIRGLTQTPQTFTEEDSLIAGSVKFTEMPRSRISRVYFYYDQQTPVEPLTRIENYRGVQVVADLASESEDQYGEQSIRKIYSRWLQNRALAFTSSFKLVNRYSIVPRQVTFRMDAKDRDLWTGDALYLEHYLDVDEFGERKRSQWTVISAEEIVPGEVVEYVCENTDLFGRNYNWMPADAGDYPGAGAAEFTDSFWTDNNGELSDGTAGARWS